MDFVVTVCVSKVATDSYVVHHVFLKERSFVMIIIMIRIIVGNMIIMIRPGTSSNSQVPSFSPRRDPSTVALWPMSLDQSPWTCLFMTKFVPSNVRTVVPMSGKLMEWRVLSNVFLSCVNIISSLKSSNITTWEIAGEGQLYNRIHGKFFQNYYLSEI